ncbi:MAG: glycosyltransferase [Bacteroidales bacterium]|nr:glycosyltransferase [Bacteroidales bacterium]
MNIEQPLVSIVSPAYNHGKFIAGCIESVLAQTYSNWEMIIVDDGSTDSTYEIASDFARKDSRIKAFTQKNIGIFRLGESYNFALKHCTGKYVAVLECDDVWLPGKLQIQVDVLESKPGCVLSWGKAYLSSIDLSYDYYLAPRNDSDVKLFYNKPAGVFLKKFIYSTLIPALTIVFRRDALLEIGGFVQGFGLPLVDIPTTLELLMKGEFAYVDQPLGKWRIYPNQVTKTYTGQMTTSYYALIRSFMKRFPEAFEEHGLTKKVIDRHFHNRLVVSYSRSGRYKLIRKDFKGARKDYLYSISHFGFTQPVWKLRSAVGIFFSFLRMDIEWLARLIGHDSYKEKSCQHPS